MDAQPWNPNGYGEVVPDSPVHVAVWIAFAACGFLVVLMSGIAAVLLAILVQREAGRPPPPPEISAVVAPLPAPERVGAEVQRQRALQAIRDGDYDLAVQLTTEALALGPTEGDLEELLTIAIDLRDRKGEVQRPAPPRETEPAKRSAPPSPRARPSPRPKPAETAPPRGGLELIAPTPAQKPAPPPPLVVERVPEPVVVAEPVVGPTEVYVFVRSAAKPRVIGQALQSQLPGMTVTAFGSFRDFEAALEAAPPDAVIASRTVLDALALPTHLQGRDAAGSPDERYVLLGKRTLSPADLAGATIGTMDVAGREQSAEFVARLLETPRVAQVKRVTEEADLLPLLQVGAADAVLVPASVARTLLASTQMDLTQTTVASVAGLPGISVLDDGRRAQLEGALTTLGADFNTKVGVASWGSE